ncbi:hypothetical protein CMV_027434 [Castanea mollissima]|uniref:Uncharacterized protein n=1 Tax=Castanea mollissima TaxID=60419 RepID=A0A8J4QFC5_9ROSI|nr:hypothetical protein CMV_027434 [Castanea mollissima]
MPKVVAKLDLSLYCYSDSHSFSSSSRLKLKTIYKYKSFSILLLPSNSLLRSPICHSTTMISPFEAKPIPNLTGVGS